MVMPIIVDIAIKNNIKFAVHFHELLSQYNYISAVNLHKAIEYSSFTVGCCDAVCESLKILGSKKVLKQYECIYTNIIKVNEHRKNELRLLNHFPEDSKIIVMSGQRIDRKGYDIFIEVARRLKDEKYYFIWLGAKKNSGYEYFLDKFIEHYNLKNLLITHPSKEDYYDYLNLADVFFLSSREDPFPLVMLEANFLNKYIISLDSGGAKEFIDTSKGHIVNSLDIENIVVEIISYLRNDSKEKKSILNRATKDFDVRHQIVLFQNLLLDSLSS
jgi:glycosyltransferase involved in cell wall biosynthesis